MRKPIGFQIEPGWSSDAWTVEYYGDGKEIHVHRVAAQSDYRAPWVHEANWVEQDGFMRCDGGCGMGGKAVYPAVVFHQCPSCGYQFEEEA